MTSSMAASRHVTWNFEMLKLIEGLACIQRYLHEAFQKPDASGREQPIFTRAPILNLGTSMRHAWAAPGQRKLLPVLYKPCSPLPKAKTQPAKDQLAGDAGGWAARLPSAGLRNALVARHRVHLGQVIFCFSPDSPT